MNEQDLFVAALRIDDAENRVAFLDRECGDDRAKRKRVEVLLQAHAEAGSFLEDTRTGAYFGEPAAPEVSLDVGSVFAGRYQLRELLGEGGMGTVYVADQIEPVQRRVALKIIRTGVDSARLLARFEQERQALALMDHPNIAKVLDAGVASLPSHGFAEGGMAVRVPYFVMELIKGMPLTRYCDDAKLTPRQRLELFIPICHAVQHAHQKGIIHRDLKPSNILIGLYDGQPVPKVIDFGVAKATGPRLTGQSVYTEVGSLIGTIEYMSPEQAELNNLDIDTRSDIYALGIILYELLTGSVPFSRKDLQAAGFAEMLRIIKEVEPPKPSTKLSGSGELPSVAATRQMEPRRLTNQVRGELDWIVMKCLEKDRNRRYETANGLAMDVGRFLADEPVQAGPPRAGYRLRKFVRRNRAAVLTAAAVVVVLLGGIAGVSVALVQTRAAERLAADRLEAVTREEARANEAANEARRAASNAAVAARAATESEADTAAFADFLAHHVLAAARPDGVQRGVGVNVTLAEALEKAEGKLGAVFEGRPKAEALARAELGVTWRNLGKYESAERHLRRALDLYRTHLGPHHATTLRAMNSLAVVLAELEKTAECIAVYEELLAIRRTKYGPGDPDTLIALDNLASAYSDAGDLPNAIARREEAAAAFLSRLGPDHLDTLIARDGLATLYRKAGQYDRAVRLHEQTLAEFEKRIGRDHPNTLTSRGNLALAYMWARRTDLALPLFESVLSDRRLKLGPDHPNTLGSLHSLGSALKAAGKPDRAIPLLDEALAGRRARLGPTHGDTLATLGSLAGAYQDARQPAKAVPLCEELLRARRTKYGADHPTTVNAVNDLGVAFLKSGKPVEAVPYLEEAVAKRTVKYGPDASATAQSANNLAVAFFSLRQHDRAIPLLERLLAARREKLGADHVTTLWTMNDLAANYRGAGRTADAVPLFEAVVAARAKPGADPELMRNAGEYLAEIFESQHEHGRAEPLRRRMVDEHRGRAGADNRGLARVLAPLGKNLLAQSKWAEAEASLRECLNSGPDDRAAADARSMLGAALAGQRKFAEAEPLLLTGYEGLTAAGQKPPAATTLTACVQRLVDLYTAWHVAEPGQGHDTKAVQWKAKLEASKSEGK